MGTKKCCMSSRTRDVLFPTRAVMASIAFFTIMPSFYVWHRSGFSFETGSRNKDLKYILLWPSYDYFELFGHGTKAFREAKCPVSLCYITQNQHLLKNITHFSAIIFNGRTISRLTDLPRHRSPDQKYIYFNMEASTNSPLDSKWNNFFNWTATYRLDSDIPFTYVRIKNKEGEIVGPKPGMKWIEKMNAAPKDIERRLRNKTKSVAWYVSNCHTPCKREREYQKLKTALSSYSLSIDVFGKCGNHSCSRSEDGECNKNLGENYHFYLAYENSCAEDYVTEKLVRAMQHYVVPIVYGGADYTRFLPPESYIDARQMAPTEIAGIIARSMRSRSLYKQFFRWRSNYEYSDTGPEQICALCAALSNRTMMETRKVYGDIQRFWR